MYELTDFKKELIDRKVDVMYKMSQCEEFSIQYFYYQGQLTEIEKTLKIVEEVLK